MAKSVYHEKEYAAKVGSAYKKDQWSWKRNQGAWGDDGVMKGREGEAEGRQEGRHHAPSILDDAEQ